jgi:zinc protease
MNRLLLICLAAASVAAAQEPGSIRGTVRLNRAPVSNEVLRVKLPRPAERRLSNGLRLLVVENHREPFLALTIQLPSSPLRDPAGLPGVADATAAMMQLGTTTRSAHQIADALADIGATLNIGRGGPPGFGGGAAAGVTRDITLTSLTENFDAALAILADIVLHPTFPADEFDKWRARERAAIEQSKSSPNTLANELMFKVLYSGDARQFTRASVESLGKIAREDLLDHYKRFYAPSGQLAGIAGDITPRDAAAKLEKALSAWKGGPVERVSLPVNPPIAEKKVYLIPRPGSVQTYLALANRAINRTDPDYIAVMVMNQVLGGGPAGRLFRIIREEKGYTYGVNSAFNVARDLNHFVSAMSVRTEVTEPALADLLKEFREIREAAVPKDELDAAKRALAAGFALRLENPANVLARWMEQREFGLPEDYWDTYTDRVAAITAEEVQRVAKKYVPYDDVQIIAVGDASKIGELVKKFGPVEEIASDSN